MADYEVQVRGLDAMRRGLRLLDPAFAKALRTAHLEIANLVAVQVRAYAPVGPTGRTQRSVRGLATQRAARVAAGNARLVYVPVVHWGWPRRNIERNEWIRRGAQAATPLVARRYEETVSRSLRAAGFR